MEFATREGALTAIETLNDAEFQGSKISVRLVCLRLLHFFWNVFSQQTEKAERAATPQQNRNWHAVFIANLPYSATTEDLEVPFSFLSSPLPLFHLRVQEEMKILDGFLSVRVLTDRTTGRSKGCAWVFSLPEDEVDPFSCSLLHFRTEEDMNSAVDKMTGAVFMGRPLVVRVVIFGNYFFWNFFEHKNFLVTHYYEFYAVNTQTSRKLDLRCAILISVENNKISYPLPTSFICHDSMSDDMSISSSPVFTSGGWAFLFLLFNCNSRAAFAPSCLQTPYTMFFGMSMRRNDLEILDQVNCWW